MNKTRDVRKHIAAAKGWLNQADDSLEQENDIQGDLKLMLAHAELQRAQEKNDQKLCIRWFKRLVPPVVACLLALGGILYIQGGRQEQEPERASNDMVQVQEAPAAALPQQEKNAVLEPESRPAEMPSVDPSAKNEDNEITKEDAINNETPRQSQQEPQVPARELQKLMQSAGSILRE